MPNPSRRPTCDFCGTDKAEVGLLFISDIGGTPSAICDGCVEQFRQVAELDRKDPALAEKLVATHNAAVKAARHH